MACSENLFILVEIIRQALLKLTISASWADPSLPRGTSGVGVLDSTYVQELQDWHTGRWCIRLFSCFGRAVQLTHHLSCWQW